MSSNSLKRKRQPTYTEETLSQAIKYVKTGASINLASRKYKIPRTTLQARISNKHGSRQGTKPALSDKDEADQAAWIERMCSMGCSISRNQIADSVLLSLKTSNKSNPFVNKRPGKIWFDCFVRRHSLADKIKDARRKFYKGFGTDATNKWFANLNDRLKHENLHGLSRTRTYSIGEVSLPMHVKKNAWCVKEGPTVLIAANAAGHLVPPMIVFDSNEESGKCCVKLPRGWSVEYNADANMTSEHLYEYVKNQFYPWLTRNRMELPIVLFFYHELATYLTEVLCDFCDEHKIILAILPSSPHQATTPIELTFFPILKREFMRHLKLFTRSVRMLKVDKNDFARRLEDALDSTNTPDNLEKGFYKCGLYPLSAERYITACIKLPKNQDIDETEKQTDESLNVDQLSVLKCIESNLDPETIESFRVAVDDHTWTGSVEDTNLFYLWRNITKSVIFGRSHEGNDKALELQSSIIENQENEVPSDYTSSGKPCVTEEKNKPLSFIDTNLNSICLDKNVSIIVVHPDENMEESDFDEV